jgi:hypothetical protein
MCMSRVKLCETMGLISRRRHRGKYDSGGKESLSDGFGKTGFIGERLTV